jgi:hypothetical protein
MQTFPSEPCLQIPPSLFSSYKRSNLTPLQDNKEL